MSMSLDGYVAGPDQSLETPLGVGGLQLHTWHLDESAMHPVDRAATDELLRPMGAYLMGRNMFGPIRGPWSEDWRGWWGDEPPYHAPVFVLTHHARDSVEMQGGTTFHFVTEGFDVALARAKEAAGDMDVDIAGGASAVRQGLIAGVVDDLYLDVLPVILGSGESMFDGVSPASLTQVDVTYSPVATHIHYALATADL
jgi:dihydrofolate reductase